MSGPLLKPPVNICDNRATLNNNKTSDFLDFAPVDYHHFAKLRDQVDPRSPTYSNNNDTGPLKAYMKRQPDPERGLVDLNHPDGCIFEAERGVPLLLLVTKLQSEELKVGPPFPSALLSQNVLRQGWRTRGADSPSNSPSMMGASKGMIGLSPTTPSFFQGKLIMACGGPWGS